MLVLRGSAAGFSLVTRMTVTSEPIRIGTETHDGWKTLIVHSRGAESLMVFNGKSYPSNPSTQPRATASQIAGATIVIR